MQFTTCLARGLAGAAILAMAIPSAAAAMPAPEDPAGSLYLQCDGQPNNMTTGESAARLLGAVTLLALLAPAPESPDASKRKFGAEGVAACTAIIEGDKKEGNPARRIGLILARAIHSIEDGHYDAAIADAGLARDEATAAGLMADPYYARTRGRAPDLIESAALFRLARAPEARAAALRDIAAVRHSLVGLFATPTYLPWIRTASDAEADYLNALARADLRSGSSEADRLEELGRFADAARVREGLVDLDRVGTPESISSLQLARAAVSHALAGETALAEQRAAEARANFDRRKADGSPEGNAAEFVELMDLFGIIEAADAGDVKTARRLFSARSQWVAVSFGAVLEMTRRLRAGAAPDELIGGLSRDADAIWKDRADARAAEMIARDKDNKTLFRLMPEAIAAGGYEAIAKKVWRTDKSAILLKVKNPETRKVKFETLFLYGIDPTIALEAYTLHAALLAKSRGQQGFVIRPLVTEQILAAWIMTGNRGEPGLPDTLFNDAGEVIADLSPIIPDPEALKARRAAR